MAEGYIDFSPIYNYIDRLGNQVDNIDRHIDMVQSEVYKNMNNLRTELEEIKKNFVVLIQENRRQAALQRALTEIIRVRQELERDFGNYKIVRNTMLGILEATDIQLIRNTTIATCTEELMLSTPRYWLAPVLIALSAWIADNKPLAIRALKEALRRDEEKTCLTFALICRRAQRTNACFEWLSRYFSKQKADDMKESIIAYIDAYTNGVFGVDRDNLCEEYIQNWMNELQNNDEHFAEKQINYWRGVYQTYCVSTANQYPKLAECAKGDFAKMNDYVMRINAAPEIISFFATILNTEVDKQILISAIDNELIKLVKNYDTEEAPLREEEEYLTDIKNSNGDESYAKRRQELRKNSRMDHNVDLAERLSATIISNRTEDISAKKTAIRFMQGYIKDAFKEFLEEKAPEYPNEITIHTHNWSGKTQDGSNKTELKASYETSVDSRRQTELASIKNTLMIVMFVLAGICGVLSIVGFCVKNLLALGIIALVALVLFVVLAVKTMLTNKRKKVAINSKYDTMLNSGKNDIELTIEQLQSMNQLVNRFNPEENYNKLILTDGQDYKLITEGI